MAEAQATVASATDFGRRKFCSGTRLLALLGLTLLAGCGRYGNITSPPGSTYPQRYPATKFSDRASGAPAGTASAQYTKDGSYIDPSTTNPVIYPQATTQALPTSPYSSGLGTAAATTASGSTFAGPAP